MKRKSLDEFKNELNEKIIEYQQQIGIVEFKKSSIEFSNGIILFGDELLRYKKTYLRSSNEEYFKHHDRILMSSNILEEFKIVIKEEIVRHGRIGGLKHAEMYPEFRKLATGRIPWNKDKKMEFENHWSRGKTKDDNEILKKISESRKGIGNPMYGKSPSVESRQKQSMTIKKLILDGKFTPNAHNSLSRWNYELNGKKYRSSWEVNFQKIHPECEYEKIRIEYYYENKKRIYITDFVDMTNKIIYELKPSSMTGNGKNKAKENAAIKWCNENGFEYKIITEIDEPRMVNFENKEDNRD